MLAKHFPVWEPLYINTFLSEQVEGGPELIWDTTNGVSLETY